MDARLQAKSHVTADPGDGPVPGQDIQRADRSLSADDLTAIVRVVELVALAGAVPRHVGLRVPADGDKTVLLR